LETGLEESAKKARSGAVGSCHKAPAGASAAGLRNSVKSEQNSIRRGPIEADKVRADPVPFASESARRAMSGGITTSNATISPVSFNLMRDRRWRQCMFFGHRPPSSLVLRWPTMTNDSDKRDPDGMPHAKASRQDSRQQRLKLALRDNLKRRKSQARQRGKIADAPSNDHERALDDESERGG
jgi:hypothetical protein